MRYARNLTLPFPTFQKKKYICPIIKTTSLMTIIANPIYDAVFKFLMENKKVAGMGDLVNYKQTNHNIL